MHDPILSKLREQKTWRKRITKAQGRKEKLDRLKIIEKQKPKYSLAHIIKERYPSFNDALRDLNDCLCMIHLFSQLSADAKVSSSKVETARRLALEFQSYVIRKQCLKKVFLSIKGIYYQAEIMGETLTWITPYKFYQEIPRFVDISVLLNFFEFYETLMGFVNFKLFHSLGIHYPPEFDVNKQDNGEGLFAVILNPIQVNDNDDKKSITVKSKAGKAKKLPSNIEKEIRNKNDSDIMDEISESDDDHSEEAQVFQSEIYQENKELESFQNLFSDCVFFLSREVPKESLEFIIRCFGGKVSWEGKFSPYSTNDSRITHHIIDRDVQPTSKFTRAFVQPQWVYDCINSETILPVEEYGINSTLPAHLSPFVDDESEGYIPKRAKEIKKLIASSKGEELMDSDEENSDEIESDDEIQEERYKKELMAEQKGISYSDAKPEMLQVEKPKKKSIIQAQKEATEEQKQFAKTMIPSRRRRRLYDTIQYTKKKKEQQNNKLLEKAKLIENQKKKSRKSN